MPPYELRTLSGVALLDSDGTELLGPGKPLALLVYLACSPRRSAGREHLVDLLWSDLPPERARHSLRQTLWYLRQILPEGVEGTGVDLTLTLPLAFDREVFLEAVNRGDLERTAALYNQDFLAGFAVPGGLEFEHWADVERQRLRAVFLRAAEQLIRRQLDVGQARDAVSLARRARDVAPETERMWRLLLEALAAGGDTIGLTLESAALSARLSQDGRDPEPATRALLERATVDRPRSEANATGSLIPALIGRELQFHRVLAAWDEVRRRHGRHLHISAGPGLGKTRLCGDLRHRLRSLGAPTIAVRATPGDRNIPFSLAAELARGLCQLPGSAAVSQGSAAALVALNPTLTGRYNATSDVSIGMESVRRRSAALSELLAAVSDEQSCVLLIDDLHWVDQASLQVLRSLLDRVSDFSSLIVTASRAGLGMIEPEDSNHLIALPPLGANHLSELMGSLAALPSASWTDQLPDLLHRHTDGVPLLVLEAIQLAIERGTLRISGGMWECTNWDELKQQLGSESAVRQRLARLEPEASRILLGFAVGGIALSVPEIMKVSLLSQPATERHLATLEQKGLIQRAGDRWQSAHDEISASAVDRADPSALLAVHNSLGRVFAESATDPRTLVRAGRHLALAAEWPELRRVFLRYVRVLRREGDARRVRHLAGDFLDGMPEAAVAHLLRTLGRLNHLRYDLVRPTVAVAASAVVILVLAVFAFTRPKSADAVLLLRDLAASGPETIRKLPVYRAEWSRTEPLNAGDLRVRTLPGGLPKASAMVASPDGHAWAAGIETGDPVNTIDIALIDDRDRSSPLVAGRRDDNAIAWLPDGSGIILTTSRWAVPGADDYDVAVQTLNGSLRRVTDTPDHDAVAYPSPDGTRIVFQRMPKTGSRAFCIVPFDGSRRPNCLEGVGGELGNLVGWSDSDHLLILRSAREGLNDLLRVDADSGGSTVLLHDVREAIVSPSGNWLAYYQLPPGRSVLALFICRTDAPEDSREVIGAEQSRFAAQWQEPRAGRFYLDRVKIVELGPLPSHSAHLLRAAVFDGDDRLLDHAVSLAWASSDTSIATIDSTGLLRPKRDGKTLVTVSASGWRSDTATIEIRGFAPADVLTERWTRGLADWIPFGEPLPEVVRDGKGRPAFWNRGDGSYPSGAYSGESWPGGRGLGVEVEVSVPLTRLQWQNATVDLIGGLDSAALGSWDHHTGGLPMGGFLGRACSFGYPGGEGAEGIGRIAMSAAGIGVLPPVDSQFRDGRWVRLRLQLFPDGTCGVALDGRAVWRSRASLPLDRPFAILLGAGSAGTRVLHGPITVWTGVRDDVDWPSLGFQSR